MLLISHRGNLNGPEVSTENTPAQIKKCLSLNFHVEIDVWSVNEQWYLGHDRPQYMVNESFLMNNGLWCHAKNHKALEKMQKKNIRCFWHQEDDYTLTSTGNIWAYPGKKLGPSTIAVLPNQKTPIDVPCYGICSDYVLKIRESLND